MPLTFLKSDKKGKKQLKQEKYSEIKQTDNSFAIKRIHIFVLSLFSRYDGFIFVKLRGNGQDCRFFKSYLDELIGLRKPTILNTYLDDHVS